MQHTWSVIATMTAMVKKTNNLNKQALNNPINMDTIICPIADNCEIHFSVDLTDKAINVIEYDTVNETKTRLTSWAGGHWRYHNPLLHSRFDLLCRQLPNLREALKEQMIYLRNPIDNERDVVVINQFFKMLATKTQKTLKLLV